LGLACQPHRTAGAEAKDVIGRRTEIRAMPGPGERRGPGMAKCKALAAPVAMSASL
jgi:hypothetical protein